MPPLPTNTVEIDVFAGDKGYELDFTLQNSDGSIYVITGSTLAFKIQEEGSATVGGGSMSLISGPAGTCKYVVQQGDFPNVANYYCQILVTNGPSTVTFGNIVAVAQGRVVIK